MPEYRIVAKIDPSGVVDGRAKVSQELAGMEADFKRSGTNSARSIETMTAAQFKAAGGVEGLTKKYAEQDVASKRTATSAAQLEAATMRVLNAVDKHAAAQAKANSILNDAKVAYAAGAISSQQFAAAQALANDVTATATKGLGNARLAQMELSHVVTASVDAYAAGMSPLRILTLEAGRLAQAASFAGGGAGGGMLGKMASFISGPYGIAVLIGVTVLSQFIGKMFEAGDSVESETAKLAKNEKQAGLTRQAHELFSRTLDGVDEALRKNKEALDKLADAGRSEAEQALKEAALQEVRLQRIQRETVANLNLAKSRLAANNALLTGVSSPEAKDFAAQNMSAVSGQIADIEKTLDKVNADAAEAQRQYLQALADYTAEAAQRDPSESIKRRYEGPDGLIAQATKAATAAANAAKAAGNEVKAHSLVTTELAKQIQLLHDKEKIELEAARRAEEDARRQGQILALPISGGTIGTRFGQIESGVGVGPHAHQGVDIRTPVGTPVYARAGGTVDYARQEGGYGNIIQINFGGGVSGRFAHLSKFNVKPGDVVDAGDIIGYTGGARGAEGAGDSTGPHLHYEERVGGRPVNPLTTKVQLDTAGAQASGYNKAAEAAKKAAEKAQAERDFVTATVDAANQTALPKIEGLTAKIKKTLDDYKKQFHEAPSKEQVAAITGALTAADARATAQHFDEAYVQPLKALREGLGLTAVQRQISNATIKEEHDLGRALTPVEREQIKLRYQMGDVYEREDKLLIALHQPLEDYRAQLLAISTALKTGKINQTEFNAEVAKLNAPVRALLDNAPGGYGQRGGININDPNAQPGDRGTRNYSNYEDASKAQDENARYADELKSYQDYRDQLMALGINYDQLVEAAHQRHVDNLNAIDQNRRDMQLSYGQQIADSVYQIAVSAFGKQSAVARAAFAVEKGFVIARASLALYDDVAQAIKVGFPQNIPLIAAAFAQGATIIAAIKGIAVPQSSGGYMAGGYTGDGMRDVAAGVVHGQEFVVNANATSRHRALLEAINSGRLSAESRSVSNDNPSSGFRQPSVQIHNHAPGVGFDVQPGASPDEVVVIARRIVREEAPGAVAADMGKSNSRTSKALGQHYGVGRKRP